MIFVFSPFSLASDSIAEILHVLVTEVQSTSLSLQVRRDDEPLDGQEDAETDGCSDSHFFHEDSSKTRNAEHDETRNVSVLKKLLSTTDTQGTCYGYSIAIKDKEEEQETRKKETLIKLKWMLLFVVVR